MALFKNIKRAFGFSVEVDDLDLEESSDDYSSKNKSDNSTVITESQSQKDEVTEKEEAQVEKIRNAIFDGVVELFNKSMPDFIKSSIDEEAQKSYIFNSLDASVKNYIENIASDARRRCETKWNNERARTQNEMASLKAQLKELEESKNEWKRQQLSVERQKRALSDRLHDLENQVASLEAEKEQYDLENKSLINKLKVSGVKEDDVENLRQEVERLQKELAAAREISPSSEGIETNNEELEQKDAEIKRLKERLSALESMAQGIDSTEKINELEKQVAELTTELGAAKEELSQARSELEIASEIQTEIEKFETLKKKKDERITELQAENISKSETIESLNKEISSLKRTIEDNLYKQAEAETILRNEIEQLKQNNRRQEKDDLPQTKRKQRKVKISAIDESIADTDWLVSTPPKGTSTRSITETADTEFGWKSPAKKVTPENDAQMSLF